MWSCREIQLVRPQWGREGNTQPSHMSVFLSFEQDSEAEQCLVRLHDKYIEGMSSTKRVSSQFTFDRYRHETKYVVLFEKDIQMI